MLSANEASIIASSPSVYETLKLIEEEARKGKFSIELTEDFFILLKNENLFNRLGYRVNYIIDEETNVEKVEISWL